MPEPAEVRTQRLLLRQPQPADIEAFVHAHTRPEAHAHSEFGHRTRDQALQILYMIERDWITTGIGYWTVLSADSGAVVGFGGIRHAEDEGTPILNLYFRFQPEAWGNGYATEMSAAAVRWARQNLPDLSVVIRTSSRNTRAIGVANKLGFERVLERLRQGEPEVVFRFPENGGDARKGTFLSPPRPIRT